MSSPKKTLLEHPRISPIASFSAYGNIVMDVQSLQTHFHDLTSSLALLFQRIPGSSIFLRYIKSSYQNDPVRSVIELLLCLFAVRYLLAPSYSTAKKSYVRLSEEEIDELVEEWTPEPLVAPLDAFEEQENEKRPVIVG
jgi:serine palmitoyltransferase